MHTIKIKDQQKLFANLTNTLPSYKITEILPSFSSEVKVKCLQFDPVGENVWKIDKRLTILSWT